MSYHIEGFASLYDDYMGNGCLIVASRETLKEARNYACQLTFGDKAECGYVRVDNEDGICVFDKQSHADIQFEIEARKRHRAFGRSL